MEHAPILVAEDNEDDVYLLRRAFTQAKLHNPLHVVSDGEQLLAYLRGEDEYADRRKYPFPALVLLDVKMPKMNGLEALAAIRNDPDLKRLVVIFLSSSDHERDINHAFDLRANSYLVKPTNTERMVDILHRFRDYWLALNQYPKYST